jgi:hypothetical protein
MYNTITTTSTYTVIDIRKTFEGCETDIRTIARRTNKWTMEYVDLVFYDILMFAENGYLKSVDIILMDTNDSVLRATKFIVNANGTAISSDRAGKNNDWENIPNTRLSIIIEYTQKWRTFSDLEKANFRTNKKLKIDWVSSSIDNSFPHLSNSNGQLYASKGFELQKTTYK